MSVKNPSENMLQCEKDLIFWLVFIVISTIQLYTIYEVINALKAERK